MCHKLFLLKNEKGFNYNGIFYLVNKIDERVVSFWEFFRKNLVYKTIFITKRNNLWILIKF
ncbi:hypothetical protein BKK53_01945 [Rodentibacter trehalosifermentans]|nr:hypothetical protein BKK53_01945 [Rodentibacter trehalosifermentans]